MGLKLGTLNITKIYKSEEPVVKIYKGTEEEFEPTPEVGGPFYFLSEQDGSTIKVTKRNNGPTLVLETSTDNSNWTSWDCYNETKTLNNGQKLYVRGSQGAWGTSNQNFNVFSISGAVGAYGDITYLSQITGKLDTLSQYYYYSLFNNSLGLTHGPDLLATTIGKFCYAYMYSLSTSIRSSGPIYALSTNQNGFQYMFNGCVSLVDAPIINTTTVDEYGCQYMFKGCTSLVTAPELLFTNIGASGCMEMFSGCTSLVNPPSKILCTKIRHQSYRDMFNGCKSLTKTPKILFDEIPLGGTTPEYGCLRMFSGCSELTDIDVTLNAPVLQSYCYQGMFSYCTKFNTKINLPATTLATSCYQDMFSNTDLTDENLPELPATTLTPYCYSSMFKGCTSLTSVPKLPATTLAARCYESMFDSCTNLVTLPKLYAETLTTYCYRYMFRYCSKIKLSQTQGGEYQTEYRIPITGTGTTASNALTNMFQYTGGSFKTTAEVNTTYYTSNTLVGD